MSNQAKKNDHGGPKTRGRVNKGQTPATRERAETAVAADQQTVTSHSDTEEQTIDMVDEDTNLAVIIESKIKEALCSKEVLNVIVKAVTAAIIDTVTQEVYTSIKMDMEVNEEEIKDLEKQVSQLKGELSSVRRTLTEHEQYSRRNCLRFYGIKETQGENTDKLVCDLARDRYYRKTCASQETENKKTRIPLDDVRNIGFNS